MKKQKADWRPIWIYLGINIIIGFALGILRGINGTESNINSQLLGAILLFATDATVAIIFLIIYHKRLKIDLKRIDKKNIIYVIVSAIILISLNEIISTVFEILNIEMNNQDSITSYFNVLKVPVILSVAILAPFVEEMTFRYSLRTICKNNTIFIIVSGTIFGLLHGIGIVSLLYIFIGICLSIIYLKNDENIMAPIFVHFLNNLVSVIEMLLLL